MKTTVWVGVVQAVLVLTWTVYALFLPTLAAHAGIPAHWVVWILVADQALFVVTDWAAGVFSDRLVAAAGRLGLAITVSALVSAGMLVSMPTLAEAGQRDLLLGVIGVWAALSSFLRAPVFSLLGRIGGASRKSGAVSLALLGVSVAGAIGPLVTSSLQRFDPRWSLGAASAALVVAGLFAMHIERRAVAARLTAAFTAWRPLLPLAAVAFLTAMGMQLLTSFGAAGAPAGSTARQFWVPLFWLGFSIGLIPAAKVGTSAHGRHGCAIALAIGAVAVALERLGAPPPLLVVLQLVAGAAWAIVLAGLIAAALAQGEASGAGSSIGVILSAISLAAMARLLIVALGARGQVDVGWWTTGLWATAALGWLVSSRIGSARATAAT